MGLFRKAGKKFEETKQAVLDHAEAGYICRSCGELFEEESEFCPHCGEDAIEPVE